ncbi:hypothetical protein GQX74_013900 [Glossina fuscipes]|nr:hypothetical protein GQX74_013900 [Glossina fuscipes]
MLPIYKTLRIASKINGVVKNEHAFNEQCSLQLVESIPDGLNYSENSPKFLSTRDTDSIENLIQYNRLYTLELPTDKYQLERQIGSNANLRTVLVDWIDEVHLQFRLIAVTFPTAVRMN